MGKSNKPTKWFKAVKNAFRSPSKERPQSPDLQGTKVDADEKLLVKHDLSPAPYQAPTPHPLPSYEIITHEEVEPEITSRGQPLPTPEAVAPAMPIKVPEKELENVIEEEENTSSNIDAEVVEKHQDDDDDSTLSEEEEAAARIQQRFSEPLALKGLIRLQALVRGHEVRRQAATTLQTMEAIVRVQATFRGRRVRVSKDGRAVRSRISKRRRLSLRANPQDGDVRRGTVFQDKEPEETWAFEDGVNKSKRPTAYLLTQQLKRSTPNRSPLFIDSGPGQPHWGWEWLELWSNARIWEIHTVERPKGSKSTNDSSKDSKDYIEIIPGPRKNSSEYTTKEVDVNTLKVKYYEDYVSNPTPAPMSRSSNPSSEKKEHTNSSSPMSEKQELAKASSHIVPEKKEPTVIRPPRLLPEKKEPGSVRSSTSSPLSEKKEPGSIRSSTSGPLSDKKEPGSIRSSTSGPLSDKKEPGSIRSSISGPLPEKKEPGSIRSSTSGPLSEKKEPGSIRSSTSSPLSEKKEPVSVRSSTSSPLSEKKEPVSVRSSTSSPFSEKKESSFSRSTPSPFSEKKESSFSRSTPSPLSQRNEPARSSTSSLFEKKELDVRSPSSPDFSEKREADYVVSDWQHTSPVATPASPSASSTGHSYRTISKPPPIEVPTRPNVVEEDRPSQVETRTLEDPKSPIVKKLAPPSPAVSETHIPALPSSQPSGSSFPVPETPPGLDLAGDDPSETLEHLALPDPAQSTNGGETNGAFKSKEAYSSGSSASNGEHQLGEDIASVKGSATASALDYVVNGHPSNGHQENGDSSKSRKGEKVGHGENGESPNVPSKRPTSHYMEPTESAKARQRSSSNPKVRTPDTPESPARTPKRFSIGGSPVTSKKTDSPKTIFGTRKSTSTFLNRGSPSPKAVTPKEKPGRSGETRAESPARRNSLGSADGKRWRT